MNIPKLLILFRLLLAPIILSLAYFIGESSKPIILFLLYIGLFSDIFVMKCISISYINLLFSSSIHCLNLLLLQVQGSLYLWLKYFECSLHIILKSLLLIN